MAEKKRKLPVLGIEFDVSEVPVVEMKEGFNEYKLEDGTVLKVKGAVTSVFRVDNQFQPDGNPIYLAFLTPVVKIESSELRVPAFHSTGKPN